MSGNNGNGRRVALLERSLPGLDRPTRLPQHQAEEFVELLADRLGERVEGQLQQYLTREVLPHLQELDGKMEALDRRIVEARTPVQVQRPADQQALQRQARTRVD